jgi:hypothetical protein
MEERSLLSRFGGEAGFALVTLAFGALMIDGALDLNIGWGEIGPEAGYFPFRVGLLIVLASLINVAWAILRRRGLADAFLTAVQVRRVVRFALPVVALVGVAMVLGIYVAAALYLLFTLGLAARHRLWITLTVSLGTPLILFVLFEIVFLTPLLKGPLENWLGWY